MTSLESLITLLLYKKGIEIEDKNDTDEQRNHMWKLQARNVEFGRRVKKWNKKEKEKNESNKKGIDKRPGFTSKSSAYKKRKRYKEIPETVSDKGEVYQWKGGDFWHGKNCSTKENEPR